MYSGYTSQQQGQQFSSYSQGPPRQQQHHKKPSTVRIYTVKISTPDGPKIYKAWELNNYKMEQHFRSAEKRYFSFRDFRGKLLHNVDAKSGWRFKMTLHWEHTLISPEGKKGGWVTQQWKENNQKRNTYRRQRDEDYESDDSGEYECMRMEERMANDPLYHPPTIQHHDSTTTCPMKRVFIKYQEETSDHDGYCSGEECCYTKKERTTSIKIPADIKKENYKEYIMSKELITRPYVGVGSGYCSLSDECIEHGLGKHDYRITILETRDDDEEYQKPERRDWSEESDNEEEGEIVD